MVERDYPILWQHIDPVIKHTRNLHRLQTTSQWYLLTVEILWHQKIYNIFYFSWLISIQRNISLSLAFLVLWSQEAGRVCRATIHKEGIPRSSSTIYSQIIFQQSHSPKSFVKHLVPKSEGIIGVWMVRIKYTVVANMTFSSVKPSISPSNIALNANPEIFEIKDK